MSFLIRVHPAHVAGCDCLYEVTLANGSPSGSTTVTLYRRWDSESGAADPLGSVALTGAGGATLITSWAASPTEPASAFFLRFLVGAGLAFGVADLARGDMA